MPQVKTNYRKIPLKRLQEIQSNLYRSSDCKREYVPCLIDDEIYRKLSKIKDNSEREWAEYEYLLRGLLAALNRGGNTLLSEQTKQLIVRDLSEHVSNFH